MRQSRGLLGLRLALVALLAGAVLGTGASAQAAASRVVIDYIDVLRAPEFRVYVDYLDAAGRPVPKLDARDLTVLLDGEPYKDEVGITQFKKSEERCAFVLLVNNAMLYSDVFEDQKKGLIEFVRGMRAKDMATVIYYNEQVFPLGDFTADKDELISAINGIPAPEKPKEAFLDALIAALDKFPEADPNFPRTRGIVMLADGLDQGLSDRTALANRLKKDLAPKAKAIGVKFYGLGYTVESNEGIQLMSLLQKNMGGYFTEIKTNQLNQLGSYFSKILDSVYGQYIISFVTSDLDSEEQHTIQININFNGQLAESTPLEFQPPPVAGTPWYVILGIIVGVLVGLGLLVGLIVFIAKRKKAEPEEEEEPERECPVCGEPLEPEAKTCESCLRTPHKAELKRIGGDWDGFIYIIAEEITTIGSREGDILIEDPTVSGKHSGIKIDDLKFELADFGSTNGTYVNGKRVSKQFLKAGDVVKLGNVDLKFNLA